MSKKKKNCKCLAQGHSTIIFLAKLESELRSWITPGPSKAKQRIKSGGDYEILCLEYLLSNENRDFHLPTLMIFIEYK